MIQRNVLNLSFIQKKRKKRKIRFMAMLFNGLKNFIWIPLRFQLSYRSPLPCIAHPKSIKSKSIFTPVAPSLFFSDHKKAPLHAGCAVAAALCVQQNKSKLPERTCLLRCNLGSPSLFLPVLSLVSALAATRRGSKTVGARKLPFSNRVCALKIAGSMK